MPYIDCEISLRRRDDGLFGELCLTAPGSNVDEYLAREAPVSLDRARLLQAADPRELGRALSEMLFAAPELRSAWERARSFGAGASAPMRLRLRLDPEDDELHSLSWETLSDPVGGEPLALDQRLLLSRYLDSSGLEPVILPPRPELRALVVVANPTDLDQYSGMAEVDVEGEVARARAALEGTALTIVGDHDQAAARVATLEAIAAALAEAPHILYLVCHGSAATEGPVLWLQAEDGTTRHVPGAELVAMVAAQEQGPLLAVLASCQSAGRGYGPALAALGPRLARAGVPAVLGFQGDVAMNTVRRLLPAMFKELREDGSVDRALAVARLALGAAGPWWQAVLWLRSRDGQIWRPAGAEGGRAERLRALFYERQVAFVRQRVAGTVGRERELAEVRAQIGALEASGGYVVVTGPAGQGKSSLLARLVAERGGQGGAEAVVHHFVQPEAGPDHPISLLRNLLARLILRHNLPDFYIESESQAALGDLFARALADLAERGRREVIFIDGLDLIDPGTDGRRALDFLPRALPTGIVVVLATRPDDTLDALHGLSGRRQYVLPELSRADFDLILGREAVALDKGQADQAYALARGNALYLDLAARELKTAGAADVGQILARLGQDPDQLFSLPLERLRRDRQLWQEVVKPILGLLMVAREPLSPAALATITGRDGERIRAALARLGGLTVSAEGRYALFHPKLADYLHYDPLVADDEYLFTAAEEDQLHEQIVDWCEGGSGGFEALFLRTPAEPAEVERGAYAFKHYIPHLASVRRDAQARLWDALDRRAYMAAKMALGPAARLDFALDLALARRAAAPPVAEAGRAADMLPRLWRYSLLRCGMNSLADGLPDGFFDLLGRLGKLDEARALVLTLSGTFRRALALGRLGLAAGGQSPQARDYHFERALEAARALEGDGPWDQLNASAIIAGFMAEAGLGEAAADVLDEVEAGAASLDDEDRCVMLSTVAATRAALGDAGAVARLAAESAPLAPAVSKPDHRISALSSLAEALEKVGDAAGAQSVRRSAEAMVGEAEGIEAQVEALFALADAGFLDAVARLAPPLAAQAVLLSDPSADLAVLIGKAGDKAGAAQRLTAIAAEARRREQDPSARAAALSALAERGADLGLADLALALFDEAEGLAHSITERAKPGDLFGALGRFFSDTIDQIGLGDDRDERANRLDLLVLVAQALVRAGRPQEARKLVEQVKETGRRAWALFTLAQALAETGQLQPALACFQQAVGLRQQGELDPAPARDAALSALVAAASSAGDQDMIERALGADPEARPGPEHYLALAEALAAAGNAAMALQALDRAALGSGAADDAFHTQDQLLASLCVVLAGAGDFSQAWRAAGLLSPAGADDEAGLETWALARGFLAACQLLERTPTLHKELDEQLTKIEPRCQAIADEQRWEEAAGSLIVGLVALGRAGDAERVARAPNDPGRAARGLAQLGAALARAGQQARAEQLFAEAAQGAARLEGQAACLAQLTLAWTRLRAGERGEAAAHTGAAAERVDAIEDNWLRYSSRRRLVELLAQLDEGERAAGLADDLEEDVGEAESWWDVDSGQILLARARAAAGQDESAAKAFEGVLAELRATPESFYPEADRFPALAELGAALSARPEALLSLVQEEWLRAGSRLGVLQTAALALPLIAARPTLGGPLIDGLLWAQGDHPGSPEEEEAPA